MAKRKRKYNEYWRFIPVKMIQSYPEIKKNNSIQAQVFVYAIERAMKETEQAENGMLKLKAVDMVYIRKTKTVDGAAMELERSRRTIQNWLQEFVVLVAYYAGYAENA